MSDELIGTIVMIAFVVMLIAVAFVAAVMSAYFSYGMIVSIIDDIKKRKGRKMTTEVLRAMANEAVKTAMSIEPMVGKTSNIGFMGVVVGIVVGAFLSAWLYSLMSGK